MISARWLGGEGPGMPARKLLPDGGLAARACTEHCKPAKSHGNLSQQPDDNPKEGVDRSRAVNRVFAELLSRRNLRSGWVGGKG